MIALCNKSNSKKVEWMSAVECKMMFLSDSGDSFIDVFNDSWTPFTATSRNSLYYLFKLRFLDIRDYLFICEATQQTFVWFDYGLQPINLIVLFYLDELLEIVGGCGTHDSDIIPTKNTLIRLLGKSKIPMIDEIIREYKEISSLGNLL